MQAVEYSDEKVFTLTRKESVHITVEIKGKVVNILIDSGSSINAMDKHTFDSLNSSQVVKKTSTTIYPYGSKTPLKLIGKSTLKAHVNDKLWEIEFHIIVGTGKPLIGHKTATDLGLLHIGMLNTLDVNTDSIISSFKDRFTELGKLKDFQLRLHIDESVQSVAQPENTI